MRTREEIVAALVERKTPRDQVVMYCDAFTEYQEASANIAKNGMLVSHPRTGAPITHTLASVTVVDKSTLRADGLSTVLMVMGTERGVAFAERLGIAAFFVTRDGDAFVTQTTQAFEQLFAAGEEQ